MNSLKWRFRNRSDIVGLQIWPLRFYVYSAFADVKIFGIGVDVGEKIHAQQIKSRMEVCRY